MYNWFIKAFFTFRIKKFSSIFLLNQESLHNKLTNLSCLKDAPGVLFIQILFQVLTWCRDDLGGKFFFLYFVSNFIQIDWTFETKKIFCKTNLVGRMGRVEKWKTSQKQTFLMQLKVWCYFFSVRFTTNNPNYFSAKKPAGKKFQRERGGQGLVWSNKNTFFIFCGSLECDYPSGCICVWCNNE